MALTKSVKIGGSYYKGYELLVSSTPGAYILDMSLDRSATVNSMSVTPDTYGAGDTFGFRHMNAGTSASVAVLGETIYNAGAGISVMFDLPAFEPLQPNEPIRLTYTNTAGKALAVHCIVEYVGVKK
jgi:hypothetical protein